jgi:hypothetical protein
VSRAATLSSATLASAGSTSLTSTTTHVTLSRPPFSLARRTSSFAAASGESEPFKMSAIFGSDTSLVSPSEQSRKRSPFITTTSHPSTST